MFETVQPGLFNVPAWLLLPTEEEDVVLNMFSRERVC